VTDLVTGSAFEAGLSIRSEDERLVDLRIVPWGTIGQTRDGPERFRRGAFRGTKPADVSLEAIGAHGNEPGVQLAGRGVELHDRDDGMHGTFRVSRTRAGDELLELARDGVYRAASVVFEPVKSRSGADGVTERELARMVRVGIVERGAYPGAEVLAVRSEEIEMQTTTPDPTPDPVPDPEPDPVPGLRVTRNDPEILARMEEVRRDLVGRMVALEARGGRAGTHPLAGYGSLVAYTDAAYADASIAPLMARALVDQTTLLNPGVIAPTWLTEIAGTIARPRPAIQALGGPKSLGSSGMDINFPYLDPALNLDAVVAKQAAEKNEINSVLVKILKGTAPISTWAGGSDVSYQLIRRSEPSYREAYIRILTICYSRETEAEFETILAAGATSSLVLTATATADQVRAFLFAASALVEDATGSPATVDLVSPAEFNRIGGLTGLYPSMYGTNNIPGTADAASLRINVSGIPIVRAPFLTGNTHLVTNQEAAHWHEDGPFPISSEDVAKLGQNIAVWGMGSAVVVLPKGIVKSTLTLVADEPEADAASSSRRK
jgi:HK97 family phage prohead protease